MGTRTTISLSDRVKLIDLLREQYVTSGMTDDQFAKLASEKLQADINGTIVRNQREAAEIQNNNPRTKVDQSPEAQIARLKHRIARLEKAMCASLVILSTHNLQLRPVLASMDPTQDEL